MDINYLTREEEEFWVIDFIDILSLQSFNSLYLPLSWRVNAKYQKIFTKDHYQLSGGVGLAKTSDDLQIYSLLSLVAESSSAHHEMGVYLDHGFKYQVNSDIQFGTSFITHSIHSVTQGNSKFSYTTGQWINSIIYSKRRLEDQLSVELGYYF